MDEKNETEPLPNEEEVLREFEKRLHKVEPANAEKILGEEERVLAEFRKGSRLRKELTKIKVLFSMLRDHIKGEYEVSAKTIAAIVVGLTYLVWPADLIPDFIPVLGQLDDLAVLFVVWLIVRPEIEPYVKWRAEKDLDYQLIYEELYGAESGKA